MKHEQSDDEIEVQEQNLPDEIVYELVEELIDIEEGEINLIEVSPTYNETRTNMEWRKSIYDPEHCWYHYTAPNVVLNWTPYEIFRNIHQKH